MAECERRCLRRQIAGLTGLGTGVGTALGVATGSAGSFVVNGGALGTPSSGVGTAIRLMQQAAGVTADGVIGPVTLNALRTYDMTHLIADFTVARLQAYREDAGWPTFGDGWTKRAILAALEAPQQLSYTDQRL